MNYTKSVLTTGSIHRIINNGDLVLVYISHTSLDYLYIEENQIYSNKYGNFAHNDFIGKAYGSKITSKDGGFVYALEATPELWGYAVHTRTQIVNEVDCSIIIAGLDIYPGCRVVESGTGSGCMTVNLARTIFPTGHVFTFEYNQVRANLAAEEFAKMNLSNNITVKWRDICGKFRGNEAGFEDIQRHSIDAVFLDVPEPWLALPYAMNVLKPTRKICCYSPCMEQVIRTCEVLRELGFYNISMVEIRQRPHDGKSIQLENCDIGDSTAVTTDEMMEDDGVDTGLISDESDDEKQPKKQKQEKGQVATNKSNNTNRNTFLIRPKKLKSTPMMVARPSTQMKGHSAFLTFANNPTLEVIKKKNEERAKNDIITTSANSTESMSVDINV